MRVDLNCDLGEGFANDEELMQVATSVNVACGGHAGDEGTMRRTVELAERYGVAIGAHPGFDDREHFGRREILMSAQDIERLVRRQVERLCGMARVTHVKPHGALYNMAARDEGIAAAVARGVKAVEGGVVVVGLAGSLSLSAAASAGLKTASEVFADRTYQRDGSLTPRSMAGAMIEEEERMIEQVMGMVLRGVVKPQSHRGTERRTENEEVRVRADTVCLHGDGAHAVAFARRLREVLEGAGVEVRAFVRGE
jgi:UPF0271 protein